MASFIFIDFGRVQFISESRGEVPPPTIETERDPESGAFKIKMTQFVPPMRVAPGCEEFICKIETEDEEETK